MNNPLVNKLLIFVMGLLGLYVFIRFGFWLLGLLLPFLFGFLLASIAQPISRFLREKLRFPLSLSSLVSLLLVIGVLGALLYWVFIAIQSSIPRLTAFFENLGSDLMTSLRNLYWTLQYRYPNIFVISFDDFIEQMREPGNILSISPTPIISTVFNFAKSLPSILLFLIITLISSYYISLEYTSVYSHLKKRLLEHPLIHRFLLNIKGYTQSGLLSWLKAQVIIMTVAAIIASIFFAFMGYSSPVLFGMFLAVFDGLPLFGAGAILWPIIIFHLIYASYSKALLGLILYLLIVLTRNFIEPRIIGKHIGINPLITLLTIFLGFRLLGVLGVIISVIVLVIGMSIYNGLKASKANEEEATP